MYMNISMYEETSRTMMLILDLSDVTVKMSAVLPHFLSPCCFHLQAEEPTQCHHSRTRSTLALNRREDLISSYIWPLSNTSGNLNIFLNRHLVSSLRLSSYLSPTNVYEVTLKCKDTLYSNGPIMWHMSDHRWESSLKTQKIFMTSYYFNSAGVMVVKQR
jgi:hypothetical protein